MGKDLTLALAVLVSWANSVIGLPIYIVELVIDTVLLPFYFLYALFFTY
ncbi:MAG TPA: hypothetical protein PLX23_09765 [Candidatus Hydrogenedens sp.]|nr:hypothetical protein [Candidatus Hydrogenedens sp.]